MQCSEESLFFIMLNIIFNWILDNYIELIGSILGVFYVLLASKQNIWCWLMGIVSCALYIFVFFAARLYGDMALQFFYLIMGFYGWYAWFIKKNGKKVLKINTIKHSFIVFMLLSVSAMTVIFGYMLSFTNNPIPYIDGFTSALGLAGTWMTARKYIENWWLWIFANTFCVGVYLYRDLYPTAIFYLIMAILAYRGYIIWKNEFKFQNNAQ